QDTGAVMRSAPDRHFTVTETIRTGVFWLLFLVCLFSFAAEQMVIVHIVPYSTAIGMSLVTASLGLSALGMGSIFGRIISGSISDHIGRIPTQIMCCAIEAVGIFALLTINGPLVLYAVMFFLGFGYGGWIVQGSLILGDVFGEKNLGMITGIWFISGLPAGVLGPLMGGLIFDATGSYVLAILIAGGVCVLAFALSILIGPSQKRLLQTAAVSRGP
ncbi:MAG: MFS transporter, partial [Chloroflexota bacterium]